VIVAVTGASGFSDDPCARISSAAASACARSCAIPRPPPARCPDSRLRCDLPDVLDEAGLAGADAVVHAAYATRTTDPDEQRRVNEDGTRRVLDAARRAGVKRFVFVSTIAAHPDAPNYYARSKHALEGILDPARDLVVRPDHLASEGHGLFQQMVSAAAGSTSSARRRWPRATADRPHRRRVRGDHAGPRARSDRGSERRRARPAVVRRLPAPHARAAGRALPAGPLPFAPTLALVRTFEALRLPFPLRSESLLGIRALRRVEVADDLRRLG